MSSLHYFIQQRLKMRKEESSFRTLRPQSNLIDFTSNDYLGLARNEDLFEQVQKKTSEISHRNGATGSRLLSGNTDYTEDVEKKLAQIFNAEAALLFNSGYTANQAVLSSIPQKGDTILYDELSHACIRDGARLSFANRFSFLHNDLTDLEEKLKRARGNIFIVVESIYSMDGDHCPLEELTTLAGKYNATIILDEAHSTGVMGNHGSGYAASLGLTCEIPIRVYTFGKGMGVHGACVVGSKELIDYLINFARPFIFTTAMTPHSVASIECAFSYLSTHVELQQKLIEKINVFDRESKKVNVRKLTSITHIQGVIIPGNGNVKKAAQQLQTKGFDVRPILSPTVAKNSERLRICLHTFNSDDEIRNLVHELSSLR